MRRIVNLIRPDYCPICKKDYCLEAYDIFENSLNISYLYDNNKLDRLGSKSIFFMKCKKCNHKFIPNWCNKEYPIALNSNRELNIFINNFKKGGRG